MSGSAKRHSKRLSEDEIDDIVAGQIEDDAAWEPPVTSGEPVKPVSSFQRSSPGEPRSSRARIAQRRSSNGSGESSESESSSKSQPTLPRGVSFHCGATDTAGDRTQVDRQSRRSRWAAAGAGVNPNAV